MRHVLFTIQPLLPLKADLARVADYVFDISNARAGEYFLGTLCDLCGMILHHMQPGGLLEFLFDPDNNHFTIRLVEPLSGFAPALADFCEAYGYKPVSFPTEENV